MPSLPERQVAGIRRLTLAAAQEGRLVVHRDRDLQPGLAAHLLHRLHDALWPGQKRKFRTAPHKPS